jgi:capsular polysaccharide biosynthesis protein
LLCDDSGKIPFLQAGAGMSEDLAESLRAAVNSPVREINLKALFNVIKKRLWIILLSAISFTVLGGIYSNIPEQPLYSASTRLIIAADSAEFLSTLRVFVREPIVLQGIIDDLDLDMSIGSLRNQIKVSSVDGSLITLITATNPDPQTAIDIANSAAVIYKRQTIRTFNFSNMNVLTNAEDTFSNDPINPTSNRAVYIGIFAGIALGIGLVFFLDSLDESVRSQRDIERLLGMTMLGQVSKIRKKDAKIGKSKRKNERYNRGETIGS